MASHGIHAVPYSAPATPHPQHQIGWVGLGNMGKSMALNLAAHLQTLSPPLPPLIVYNRTTSKTDNVVSESKGGCRAAKSPAELAQSCDLIFTSLSNDAAAHEVYAQLLEGEERRVGKERAERTSASSPTIFVDTSTLYPETTGEIERLVSALPKRYFLSAPAFGPPPMAKEAKLVFAVAGPHQSKKFVAQFLVPAMGRKIMDFGSNPERAASFKLIGNSMIIATIEMLSECMTLADKTGVGADRLYEFIQEFYPAPSALGYGKKILNNNFNGDEGFSLSGGIKDASHIRRLGESVDCPVPIVDVAHQHMIAARANGGSHLDWSSLVAGQRLAAGLPPFKSEEMLSRESGASHPKPVEKVEKVEKSG